MFSWMLGQKEIKPVTNDFPREKLNSLRVDANQSMQRFARNRQAPTLWSLTSGPRERHRTAASEASATSRPASRRSEGASVDIEASASGVTVDEERQGRAMAKEIKRLIVEDCRRGLGVGG